MPKRIKSNIFKNVTRKFLVFVCSHLAVNILVTVS